jgi:hypothetical protein
MTEEQVLAGAEWLALNLGAASRPLAMASISRRADFLRWSRGILEAAEAVRPSFPVAAPAPAPEAAAVSDVERMWKAVRDVS